MKKLSPRDFCIWLHGYLDNQGKPEYSNDFRSPIERKLKEVDLSEPVILNNAPPITVPIQPNWNQPWYNTGPTCDYTHVDVMKTS